MTAEELRQKVNDILPRIDLAMTIPAESRADLTQDQVEAVRYLRAQALGGVFWEWARQDDIITPGEYLKIRNYQDWCRAFYVERGHEIGEAEEATI
jgi:hypothetical protein